MSKKNKNTKQYTPAQNIPSRREKTNKIMVTTLVLLIVGGLILTMGAGVFQSLNQPTITTTQTPASSDLE